MIKNFNILKVLLTIFFILYMVVSPSSAIFVQTEEKLNPTLKEGEIEEFNLTIFDIPSYAENIVLSTDLEYYNEKPLINLVDQEITYNISNLVIPIKGMEYPITITISGRAPVAIKRYKCGPNELMISLPPPRSNSYDYYNIFISDKNGGKLESGVSESFNFNLPSIKELKQKISSLEDSWDQEFAGHLFDAGLIDIAEEFVQHKKPGLPIFWVIISIVMLCLGLIIGFVYAKATTIVY